MTADAAGSSWKDAEVARRFLDERRRAIPLGDEQVAVLLRLARHFVPQPARVADLGCGDGFLARVVLSEFPTSHALLIDHSEPMLRRAHESMRPFSGRYEIRHGDLSESPPDLIGDGPFDLIVSGYAIHHLPTTRKRSLYREVFDSLRPGGLFVNVEHVASATPSWRRSTTRRTSTTSSPLRAGPGPRSSGSTTAAPTRPTISWSPSRPRWAGCGR
jgi:SAM-dependent methyltransferase